jgi:hypothetical protein
MISSIVREDTVGIWSSLQTSESYYAWGISGSEFTSVALWGTSAIYSASKYGNWDCSDPIELIKQYNSTLNDDTLSIFDGILQLVRSMIDHARVSSVNHSLYYDEPIGVESLTQSVADLALRFGEGASGEERLMSRPFGVALLVAGIDKEKGPQLYHTEHYPIFFE